MDNHPGTVSSGIVANIKPWPNPWARISEVAARVGVKPYRHGALATITAKGADGESYDVWEVIIGVLDKLESGSVIK